MDEPLYQILGMPSWTSFWITQGVIHVFDAIVCALIARNRGRDMRAWVAAALVGGVLAMATLLLLPRRKPADPTQRAVEA